MKFEDYTVSNIKTVNNFDRVAALPNTIFKIFKQFYTPLESKYKYTNTSNSILK